MAGMAFEKDGWRGTLAREFSFAGVAVIAQGIASYLLEEGRTERGVLIGHDNPHMGPLFAERIAEVLAGNGIPAVLLDAPVAREDLGAEARQRSAAGSILVTVAEQVERGGLLFAPAGGGSYVSAVEWHVREIERKRTEVRVTPYARGVKAGMISRSALGLFDGTGQFSYNAC